LLYTAQRADIETLFAEHGFTVAGVSISVDPFTGRNPSYCFVDLDSPEEAQRAIAELNGVDVRGRALRVSPGVAKRGSAQGQGQGQAGSGGREVRVKNFERGWNRETREERSKWHYYDTHHISTRHQLLISNPAD
jgi:RNA recognition motif-containing protein